MLLSRLAKLDQNNLMKISALCSHSKSPATELGGDYRNALCLSVRL